MYKCADNCVLEFVIKLDECRCCKKKMKYEQVDVLPIRIVNV